MKSYILILFTCFSLSIFSQTAINKSSISTSGGASTVGNKSIIFTVGELAIQEQTINNIHLSEGFIGSDLKQVLGVSDFELFSEYKVYPNPTSDYVNIVFSKDSNYEISITDLNGRIINRFKSKKLSNTINMSRLNAGIYLIVLKDIKSRKYNSIKLIKK